MEAQQKTWCECRLSGPYFWRLENGSGKNSPQEHNYTSIQWNREKDFSSGGSRALCLKAERRVGDCYVDRMCFANHSSLSGDEAIHLLFRKTYYPDNCVFDSSSHLTKTWCPLWLCKLFQSSLTSWLLSFSLLGVVLPFNGGTGELC